MDFDNIFWHDGILADSLIKTNEVYVKCAIYPNPNPRERMDVRIVISGIIDATCVLEINSMMDKARAGNITNAKLDFQRRSGFGVKLFLADGYFYV